MGATKPINITQYFGFVNHTTSDIEDIRDYIHSREIRNISHLAAEPTLEFEIAGHAFPRWNTRVGPVVDNASTLGKTIGVLYGQRRVKLYFRQCIGIIDDDILFTFEQKSKRKIRITTFYGRAKLVPYLEDFEVLRKYNRKSGDFVNLEQTEEVLNAQSLVTHKEVMFFKGSQQEYALERFLSHFGEIVFITVLAGPHRGLVMEINPQEVDLSVPLNRRCLGALKAIGYDMFVEQYVTAMDEQKKQAIGA